LQIKSKNIRFIIAFAASIAVHVLLAFMITLSHHDTPLPKKKTPQFMDVVLLDNNKPSIKAPKNAKTVSNRSAKGGSSSAKDRTTRAAKSPSPGMQKNKRKPTPPQTPKTPIPKPASSTKRQRIIATHRDNANNRIHAKQPQPTKKKIHKPTPPTPKHIPLANLMPSSMALSELSRDFERERRMKQRLSREADIPINTKEVKYAPYARSLVRTLEEQWRPGKADYDKYGERARQVLMRVTIESNGELGNLEILRPSPIATLNESAIRAIHDAAPFKPLPSSWGLDRASFYFTFQVIEDQVVFRAL
jgi:TonB family protein